MTVPSRYLVSCVVFFIASVKCYVYVATNEDAQIHWLLDPLPNPAAIVRVRNPKGITMFVARGTLWQANGDISDRLHFEGNTTAGDITFILKNVTSKDSGVYNAIYDNQDYYGITLVVDARIIYSEENSSVLMLWNIPAQSAAQAVSVINPKGSNMFVILGKVAYPIPTYNGRYNFSGDTTIGKIEFILYNVTKSDSGDYKYRIGTSVGTGVTLAIYVKPDKPSIHTISTPQPNSNLTLICVTKSNTLPAGIQGIPMHYTWFMDGQTVIYSSKYINVSNRLVITNIDRQGNGREFTCQAEESPKIPSDISEVYTIAVEFIPLITLSPSSVNYTKAEGDYFHDISCSSDCSSNCKYVWNTPFGVNITGSVLSLGELDRKEHGIYKCFVSNDVGETVALVDITVQYAPDVDLTAPSAVENQTNVILTCKAIGRPDKYQFGKWKQIYGSTVIRDTFSSNNVHMSYDTLVFKLVNFQDIGTYSCEVQNGVLDKDGNLIQTDTAYFNVKGSPKIIKADAVYTAVENAPFIIEIQLVSNPNVTKMAFRTLTFDLEMASTSNIKIAFFTSMIQVQLHGVEVLMQGYIAQLKYESVLPEHKGKYAFVSKNEIAETVHHFSILTSGSLITSNVSGTGNSTEKTVGIVLIVIACILLLGVILFLIIVRYRQAQLRVPHALEIQMSDVKDEKKSGEKTVYESLDHVDIQPPSIYDRTTASGTPGEEVESKTDYYEQVSTLGNR